MNEQQLETMLATPSKQLCDDFATLNGDLLVLGAGGKMGPSLAVLASNALKAVGSKHKVIAVSRYTDAPSRKYLDDQGITTISCNLLDAKALSDLPDCENIVFMAGRKFGTQGGEELTWAMNAKLPGMVTDRYPKSRYVVFSTGNVYPMVKPCSGGCREEEPLSPSGDYAMSCLGRERIFSYAATEGAKVALYRLSYAIDFRYGVLSDIARAVLADKPVSLGVPCFNCIWQGSANEIALRSLFVATSPALPINVSGPETVGVRYAACALGKLLGKTPIFEGEEGETAFLSNTSRSARLFGYPTMGIDELIERQAKWIIDGGRLLDKPTKFEVRSGQY